MEIRIHNEELQELSDEISDLIERNNFLLDAISSLKKQVDEQTIYGVEKALFDKLEIYESYFKNDYVDQLHDIQNNITLIGSSVYDIDQSQKGEIL